MFPDGDVVSSTLWNQPEWGSCLILSIRNGASGVAAKRGFTGHRKPGEACGLHGANFSVFNPLSKEGDDG